jgi:hypothetical protein
MTRSLLHVATDWPGHYPNGAATVTALVEAGGDVHARLTGPHTETPLHWAASSDDVDVLDALPANHRPRKRRRTRSKYQQTGCHPGPYEAVAREDGCPYA